MFQLKNSHIRGCWGTKPGLGSEMVVTGDRWPASVPLTDTSFRRHPKHFFGFDQIFKTRWKLENKMMNIIYRIYIYRQKNSAWKNVCQLIARIHYLKQVRIMEDFHFCWETTLAVCDRCAVYIIYLENRMDIFCFPLWVLPTTDVFFCSIAYFGFWLWRVVQILWQHRVRTSSDSFQRGFSIQSGANWESWSGTQIWPQILPYFPPNLDVPIKYQYFFNIMLKKK